MHGSHKSHIRDKFPSTTMQSISREKIGSRQRKIRRRKICNEINNRLNIAKQRQKKIEFESK